MRWRDMVGIRCYTVLVSLAFQYATWSDERWIAVFFAVCVADLDWALRGYPDERVQEPTPP